MEWYRANELYHHGIKGQKWGIRRWQNADGSLTEAGVKRLHKREAKTAKESEKLEKRIGRIEQKREKMLAAREKNYGKLSAKLDKSIASGIGTKTYADYRKEDFRLGTKAMNLGYDRYIKTIKDYKTLQISAINDPSIKKSRAYKEAGKAYSKQVFNDINYGGMAVTTLMYAGESVAEVEGRK